MDGRRWERRDPRRTKKQKLIRSAGEEVESKLGYDLFSEGEKRLGWLLTFASVSQLMILLIANSFICLTNTFGYILIFHFLGAFKYDFVYNCLYECYQLICLQLQFNCCYLGFFFNRNLQSSYEDEDSHKVYSCVDLYFVSQVNSFCFTAKHLAVS